MLGTISVVSRAAKFNSDFVVCLLLCITAYCKNIIIMAFIIK